MVKDVVVKTEAPVIDFPLPEGECYEVQAPDTLDLADNAKLALNGLGGTINPDMHYEPYAYVHYHYRTPFMRHDGSGLGCAPKYAESFPMMRIMCGSDLYADREAGLMKELVAAISPDDGLYYNLYRNRPWHTSYRHGFSSVEFRDSSTEDLAGVFANGRIIRAMVAWRDRDGEKVWDKRIRAMAKGLTKIAVDKGDYAYYPEGDVGDGCNYPRSGWKKFDEPTRDDEGVEGAVTSYHGHQIYGLSQWYEISGDKAALDLAKKLANFCMKPKFWGAQFDPICIAGDEQAHFKAHTHGKLIVFRGLLEFARVTNDFRVMEFVRSGYEFARTLGIRRLGWLNITSGLAATESCVQGDLVALGIRLSDMGIGDYWDDVDAVVRNALTENQVSHTDLLEKLSAASGSLPEPSKYVRELHFNPGQVCMENVIPRTLGTFFLIPGVTSVENPYVLLCCTGNATQGLYYAWEGILREENGTVLINLLLNRASPWADIDSYLPYEGKVVIKNKKANRIGIRIPAWVDRKKVQAKINNLPPDTQLVGNRLFINGLKGNEQITLQFPISESTATYTVMKGVFKFEAQYTCTFRGSTLVDISPRDKRDESYPLYLREHMRTDKAPMKKVTRFVSKKSFLNW